MKTDLSNRIVASGNEYSVRSDSTQSPYEQIQKLQAAHDVRGMVGSPSEFEDIVQQVAEAARHALGTEDLAILLLDSEAQELSGLGYGLKSSPQEQIKASAKAGIAGWVVQHEKPLIVNDVINNPLCDSDIRNGTRHGLRSIMCVPLLSHDRIIGVVEVFNKLNGDDLTEHDLEILVPIANTAGIAVESSRTQISLIAEVKSTIKALAAAIDAKDPYTCGHSQRVVQYSLMAGRSLSLCRRELEIIEYSGILHDVGKIGIPDATLSKRSPLTVEEYLAIHKHPIISADIIDGIPFLEPARDIVLHHHEKYNGFGYPDGLIGEDIPMGARILAVGDAYDAMTTDRPYRSAMSERLAILELHKCAGKQFCPLAVDAFLFARETEPGLYEWRSRSQSLK